MSGYIGKPTVETAVMKRLLLAFALWCGLAQPGLAQSNAAGVAGGSLSVERAWARATSPMAKTGAAYVTIVNKGDADDRLVSAATPASDKAQLHETIEDHGVMKMRPLPALEIKAGATVTLVPGQMHVMLVGLKAPLKLGDTFPLTLTFEKAGPVEVTVKVEKPGTGTMDHAMPGMQM
jgi:copper(I)-binding protein